MIDEQQILTRALSATNSWDPETREFEAVIATDTPVPRRDSRGPFLEVLDPSGLAIPDNQIPLLDSHRSASVRDLLGVVLSTRVEGAIVLARLRLSSAEDAAPIGQRIADGVLRGVSIGYRVSRWAETNEGGQRIRRALAWALTEVTLTSAPADPNAAIRQQDPSSPTTGTNPMENEELTIDAAEATRRSEIRGLCRSAGLGDDAMDRLIDSGATVAEAKAEAFDHVQTRASAAPVIRATAPANDDPQVIVRRQTDALVTRMTGGECPDESRQFLGDSLLDLAKGSLERAGISTRGMMPDDVFQRAAMHTTSDFPVLLSNAMGKTAAQAYTASESALKQLCRTTVLSNFKPSTQVRLGELGRLDEMAETGEFKSTTRAENGESMSLKTYGKSLNVSRNLLINDDLGLLGDITSGFGTAAAQTEADILVALLESNPDLSDGTAVFAAGRNNYSAAAGGSLSTAGSSAAVLAARTAMRKQKGLDGETLIDALPRYMLVSADQADAAEAMLAEIFPAKSDDVNVLSGRLSLIVEPRLAAAPWYLFSDPARVPVMRYGYLAGAQGVQIQRQEAWTTLGVNFRAFLDFGAGFTDFRGAYKNAGTA